MLRSIWVRDNTTILENAAVASSAALSTAADALLAAITEMSGVDENNLGGQFDGRDEMSIEQLKNDLSANITAADAAFAAAAAATPAARQSLSPRK